MIDVIIIGGGLSGSFTAFLLSQFGLKVTVLEEHPETGSPRFCTGIVGTEAFKRFSLPTVPIQNSYSSAIFHSPYGNSVRISHPGIQAVVVDRTKFDQELSEMAIRAGASYRYQTRGIALSTGPGGVEIVIEREKKRETLTAKTAVLATGTWYGLHTRLGLSRPKQHLDTAQVEVDIADLDDVELFFGRDIAPGSFGWAAPLSPGRARIGVSAYRNAGFYLEGLLQSRFLAGRIGPVDPKSIRRKVIPVAPMKRSYGNRYLVVGDAAGQVKPTTGGGIYYGLLSAELAAHNLNDAFMSGDFSEQHFSRYHQAWQDNIGTELRTGRIARAILAAIPDSMIDSLIQTMSEEDVLALIQKEARFDWHHNIFLTLIRHPKIFYQFSKRILSFPEKQGTDVRG
ncbi:MAG TPA: NAD(P)/FAD-dependent oxidoreductase [Nitrospiria bacterium]|nr:NAD(P)/FAD-dependent oxidoreductase [Nitrospiria bacterium]